MRILFTSAGGRGHSDPLLPIARAAQAAGHTVAFCCRSPMAEPIEAAGFRAFCGGPPIVVLPQVAPLAPIDTEREHRAIRERFVLGLPGQRATAVRELCQTWRPEILVCDDTDFGALIAATELGLPYATVAVIAAGSFLGPEVIAEPLDRLRAEHGLDPDPGLDMLTRYLAFVPGPPSFRDPARPLAPTAHSLRPAALEDAATDHRRTASALRTSVYFTLGTVFNMESGDLFTRVLDGLRELDVDVVATVGPEIDPAMFGPQPPNIHIARYIAQAEVLPTASVVVSHAGSGTVLGALAYGVPAVLVPMGADQPSNAARCVALGVARVLDALSCTPADVRDAVAEVIEEPGYRERAGQLRDETRALPGSTYAVELLERLASERGPIPRVGIGM